MSFVGYVVIKKPLLRITPEEDYVKAHPEALLWLRSTLG